MGRAFRTLSVTGAALTANAFRPFPPETALSVPSFFAGWLTSELAPHNLAVTAAASLGRLAGRRPLDRGDRAALALNAASAVGLAVLAGQAMRTGRIAEQALTEGLGSEWPALLDPAPDRRDLATPWRLVALPWQVKDPAVRRVRDIAYHPDGRRRHRLDVYTPREGGRGLPVLLQVHGGGWVIGRKDQQGLPLMTHLAARGWVCVAPNYRLAPRSPWPAQIVDLKRALAWVRANIADYGGDPDFVAVTGGSAGGHLAALLALTPNDPALQPGFTDADTTVQACVPHYGVYDVANTLGTAAGQRRLDKLMAPIVMRRPPDDPVYRQASPICHVRADAPPFFVIHGSHDSLVPVAEAREFVARLRAVSRSRVAYAELPGTQHAFDVFPSIRSAHVVRAVERFLRWVRAEQRVPAEQAS